MKAIPPPKFISNSPIGEDLFQGKSHQKLAKIVAKGIVDDATPTIGIEGTWGSGKSNLVKLIQNELDDKYHFYIYDLWGHQEDKQRETILYELIDFLVNKEKILDEKEKDDAQSWKHRLKDLLAKKSHTVRTSAPRLSLGVVIMLFTLVCTPLINVYRDIISTEKTPILIKILAFGWPILLLVLIMVFYLLVGIYNKNKYRSMDISVTRFMLENAFRVYQDKQQQESIVEMSYEEDATVKEFRNWLRNIDVSIANGHKLVVVFDNFDRIPNNCIQSVWSLVNIFFNRENAENEYENIKILVPFDRKHIIGAFGDPNQGNIDAIDYIDKTFSIVYRIAPPIMSDWKYYFQTQWVTAFSDEYDEKEYHLVLQIYEAFNENITPRRIISFINDIVSLRLLHDSIPDRYLAVFSLKKDELLNEPLDKIVRTDYLKGVSFLFAQDEEYQKYITALIYQLDPENALDIVYKGPLKNALMNGDDIVFNEIAQTKIFVTLLPSVINELDNFDEAILLLDQLEISNMSHMTKAGFESVWESILLKVSNNSLKSLSYNEADGVLLCRIESGRQSAWIRKILQDYYSLEHFDPIVFSDSIQNLSEIINKNAMGINIFGLLVQKEIGVEEFLALVEKQKKEYSKFKLTAQATAIDEHISQMEVSELCAIDYLEYIAYDMKLPKLDEKLRATIKLNKSDPDIVGPLLKNLKYTSADKVIKDVLSEADVYTLYRICDPENELIYDLIALRLCYGNGFNSAWQTEFDDIMKVSDESLVDDVFECIQHYIGFGNLLVKSTTLPPSNLFSSIVNKAVKERMIFYNANVLKLIEIFDKVVLVNGMDAQEFIGVLSRWNIPEFSPEMIESIPNEFFSAARSNNTNLARESINFANNYFDGLDQDEWESILTQNGKLLELVHCIGYSKWNSHAKMAINEYLCQIAETGILENPQGLQMLLNDIERSGSTLTTIFKNLRDAFIRSGNIDDEIFLFFAEYLFKYSDLKNRAADVVRTIFKVELLKSSECVALMTVKATAMMEILKLCPKADKADFISAIKDRIDSEPSIKELAKLLHIRRRSRVITIGDKREG